MKIVSIIIPRSIRSVFTGMQGSYCSQSSRHNTSTKASKLVDIEPVLAAARQAKENGSTRFCMGAAWRDLAGRKRGFERILTMVREVRGMGMEVCTTLGMLSPEQARQLKEACVFDFSSLRLTSVALIRSLQWSHGVQSQSRHIARVLPQGHHYAILRRAARHYFCCSRCGHQCLLWWYLGSRRNGRGPCRLNSRSVQVRRLPSSISSLL